jgi:hypothetical protein
VPLDQSARSIAPITLRDIIDLLVAERAAWSGPLEAIPFLGRLDDLEALRLH